MGLTKEAISRTKLFDVKKFGHTYFQSVYLDEKSCKWLLDITQGVLQYNIINGSTRLYPIPYRTDKSTTGSRFCTTDNEGNIWLSMGARTDPYTVFNVRSHTYSTAYNSNPPHAIFFRNKKRILAYEDKLLFEDSPSRIVPKVIGGKKTPFYSFDGIMDNYGRLWMTAGGNGLFYYNEKNNSFGEYHHTNSKVKSLPFDLTTCLFIDRNENLWIGIDGGGVAKLDLKYPKFNLFPLSEGDFPVLNDYFTKCFYQDEKGRIWFGSQSNGLNILDPATQVLENYHYKVGHSNSLPLDMVASIIKDNEGNMWIGSSGGISMFDQSKKTFQTIVITALPKLSSLVNTFVYKMVLLQNGDLLAATLLGIIKIKKQINNSYKGIYYSNNPHLTSSTTDVIEMPDKTIYATLPGQGLYKFNPAGDGYTFVATFLNGIDLRTVRRDEKDSLYLWIGSVKGLVHFNTTTHAYHTWNESDGIANSYVYGSLEDSIGNLWVSTNRGLSFFNVHKKTFDNYNFEDGLQSNEFNTQSFYKSNTRIFYFGGIKGFNWFNPGYITKTQAPPVAAITKIEINDVVFQKDSAYQSNHTISVPYDKNDFNSVCRIGLYAT